ncbi:MAG: hypothetical protein LUH58_07915 [Lachnospiraceae bacterium]|nr:hypothetical protein [Lachnospiraceae bacterium]
METLTNLYEQIREIFLAIWYGSAAEETGTHIFIAVMVFAVCALAIYLVISFILAPWKEKLHSLITLTVTAVIVTALLWAILYF